jgi:hypothetical protein
MTDAALDNALARRATALDNLEKITKEINDLLERHTKAREELERIDYFIHQWHEMAGIQLPETLEQKKSDAPVEGGKRIRPKNPPREIVAATCVEYIRIAGRPLMRAELLERLHADGVIIRGKDPAMVLSTMLWRSKDVIRRLRGGGYWPADDPLPPGVANDLEDIMS